MFRFRLLTALLLAFLALPAAADFTDVEHPFMLWTKDEAAAIRKRIESDPLAGKQYERMLNTELGRGNPTLLNLFKYMVMGDEAAGERELKALLGFQNHKPDPMTWDVDPRTLKWNEGMPSSGDRHQRDEQTLNVWRYDVLYDKLTPQQRKNIQNSFRSYIQFHLDGAPPRHPAFNYDRTSWLPNMHWPRPIGTHNMAVALKDPKLIKAMFESDGGWKWYFDEYIADGQFYMEEFGKYYSNIGSMLMYCEGLEHLGLGEYGYGYTGKGGATMRKFLWMYIQTGYPRVDIPGGMPIYPRVTMGDAKGSGNLVGSGGGQHDIIGGYLPNGKGGTRMWSDAHMNGPLPKMHQTFWYEIGHKRFPEDGYGYFLAQMRKPGEDIYLPSLFFGCEPIDPDDVQPPTVESYLAHERGFALLRMEESPKYWASDKPAVAQQFGMYYVHYVHDCFSLLGYHAFNRAIYLNGWGGGKKGYAGGNAWKDSVRGHAGVVVDNLKAKWVDRGENGLENHKNVRFASYPIAKLSGARARGVYPNVDLERVLVLTDDYLFDVYALQDVKGDKRRYEWAVHGGGSHINRDYWSPSSQLHGSMLYRPIGEKQPENATPDNQDLTEVHKLSSTKGNWHADFVQDYLGKDISKSPIPAAFFEAEIGVRVHMLGVDQTTEVFAGRPPINKGTSDGFTLLVRRDAVPKTTFLAVHEPYKGGVKTAKITEVKRIEQSDTHAVVHIVGKGIDDYVFIEYLKDEPTHMFVRVGKDQVEAYGDAASFSVTVDGKPKLTINGKAAEGKITGGKLTWSK